MANCTTANEVGVGIGIKVSWSLPANNGDAVNQYLIEIKTSGSSYSTELTFCNGADPIIVAQRYCIIPIWKLRAAPFSLTKNTVVSARAKAGNVKGLNGTYSLPNLAGGVIEVEPDAPSSPTRNSATTWNNFRADWNTLNCIAGSLPCGGATASI
jgi:hypothetical protein